jgi:hypothetical protein
LQRAPGALFIAFMLAGCGSEGGGADAGPGIEASAPIDGAHAESGDAQTPDAATDAATDARADATEDASADSDALDAGDGSPACTGMPQAVLGSCVLAGASDAGPPLLCIEYTGTLFTSDAIMAACSALSADYSTQPCPTQGLHGRCIQNCAQSNESVDYFYSNTAAALQQACAMNSPPGYFLP